MEIIKHIIFFIYFSDISIIPGKSFFFQPKHNTHDGLMISATVGFFVAKALIPSSLVGKFAMVAVHVSA